MKFTMIALAIAATLGLSACSKQPDEVALAFHNAVEIDFLKAKQHLAEVDLAYEDIAKLGDQKITESTKLAEAMTQRTVKSTAVEGDTATVVLAVAGPDHSVMWTELSKEVDFLKDPEGWEAARVKYLKGTPATTTDDLKVLLVRENGDWRVLLDLKRKHEEQERKEREREITEMRKAAEERGWQLSGTTEDEIRTSLCAQLSGELPLRGKRRDAIARVNSALYDCPDPGPATLPPHRYWSIDEKVNAIDDSKDVILSLRSGTDDDPRASTIIVRCRKRDMDAYMTTKSYVGNDHSLMVRRDKAPAQRWWGSRATSGDAVFFSKPRDFLRSLAGVATLVVQYKPHSKVAEEVIFDVRGIDAAAAELRTACPF